MKITNNIDSDLDCGWPPSLLSNGGVPLDDLFLFVDPVAIKTMIKEEGLLAKDKRPSDKEGSLTR